MPGAASDSGYAAQFAAYIALLIYVQLSLQAGFIQQPAIRHPYPARQGQRAHQRRPNIRHMVPRSPEPRAQQPIFRTCHTRKTNHAAAFFIPTCSILPTVASAVRRVTDCGLSFKWREKIVLRANAHCNAGGLLNASNAIHGHINVVFHRVRTGFEKRCKWNCSCHVLRQ